MTMPDASPDKEAMKPCPACGSAAFSEPGDYGTEWRVYCSGSECYFEVHTTTYESAIAAWNRRALTTAVEDMRERCAEVAADEAISMRAMGASRGVIAAGNIVTAIRKLAP
jgi:hypothetical protein